MKLNSGPDRPGDGAQGMCSDKLRAELTAYATYYQETTGRAIDVWPLVAQMPQQFVDTDRDSQAWRWRTENGPGGAPMASERRDQWEGAGRNRRRVTR